MSEPRYWRLSTEGYAAMLSGDAHAVLQELIDAAADDGGGTVELPRTRVPLSLPLIVPRNVRLVSE